MTCPVCKTTELVVKNNNYFCPNDNIFIGPVGAPVQVFEGNTASKFQSHIQAPTNDPVVTDPYIKDYKAIIKSSGVPLIVLVIIFGLYFSLTNVSHYLSFSPMCNIQINEETPGFKDQVTKDLSALKDEDKNSFDNVCKYVNEISESSCPVSDSGRDGRANFTTQDHCYVKGTKVIYLTANSVSDLNQTAKFSQAFWQ